MLRQTHFNHISFQLMGVARYANCTSRTSSGVWVYPELWRI